MSIPSGDSSPITPPGVSSAPPERAEPALKSEIDSINKKISDLFDERGKKVAELSKGNEAAGDELRIVNAAIKKEFKKLDQALIRLVKETGFRRSPGRESKSGAEELPKAFKYAFDWENKLRKDLEKEVIRAKLIENGDLEGLSSEEAEKKVDEFLAKVQTPPDILKERVRAQLKEKGELRGLSPKQAETKIKRALAKVYSPGSLDKLFISQMKKIKAGRADNPRLQQLGDLYLKAAQPLANRAKVVIGHFNFNSIGRAAAEVGKAASAGFAAMVTKQTIRKLGTSAQQVFLAEPAVFKKGSARGEEEEKLFTDLAHFLSPTAVMTSFKVREATPSRVGASPASQQEKLRGLSFAKYEEDPRLALEDRISPEDLERLEAYLKLKGSADVQDKIYLTPILEADQKVAYEQCENCKWDYEGPEGRQILGFKELHLLYLKEGEAILKQVTAHPQKTPSPSAADLHLALNVKWKVIIPEVMIQKTKEYAAYEKCKNHKWEYETPTGTKIINFAQLEMLFREKGMEVFRDLTPMDSPDIPSVEEIKLAIASRWTLATQFAAKPFAQMRILSDLKTKQYSEMLNKIAEKLTAEAQQQMVLTLTLQSLDLHSNNIGFRQIESPKHELLRKSPNYQKVLEDYLSGKITASTPLRVLADGTIQIDEPGITTTLNDFPELLEALDAPWVVVVFDTDLSVGESNTLQQMKINGVLQHFIPLRSGFLAIPAMRDKPLTPETLELLRQEDENLDKLKAWMKGEDRPIFQALSPAGKKRVEAHINPVIKRLNLSTIRKIDSGSTLSVLTNAFATELSEIPKNITFWVDLSKEKAFRKLDLISSSPQAQANRMKIAAQLFPRMTARQQKALIDRKQAQKIWLNEHEKLQKIVSDPAIVGIDIHKSALGTFIYHPNSPLSLSERAQYITQLKAANDIDALKKLGQELVEKTKPTYFNAAKAMYPLLADASELATVLYGEAVLNRHVGDFLSSLEDQIKKAELKGGPARRAASFLDDRIRQANTPGASDPPSFLTSHSS